MQALHIPMPVRRHAASAFAAGLALLLAAPQAFAVRYQQAPLYVPGEVLVQYRSGAEAAQAKSRQLSLGLAKKRDLRDGRTQLLKLPAISDMRSMLALLQADPTVAFAEPNYLRHTRARRNPNDPLFPVQWGLRSTGQPNFVETEPGQPGFGSIPGADMNMLAAWDADDNGTFERVGNRNVIVAIIDDAFDLTHPDLAANFVQGRDLVNDDNDPSYDDDKLDHGTLVAGSLGAVGDNGIGIAGIVWNASMMPLRIGDINSDGDAELSSAAILDAYDYALENGAQIVNASYGGPSFLNSELQALTRLRDAGILFVTSAGNFNSNLDYSVAAYPANYDLSNIVSVAATNRQDNIASFSQYGPLSTDVAAPGLQIVTTAIDGEYVTGETCNEENGSCGVNGTSFSAPHVAGIAALLKAAYPNADYRELKARLIEGAEPGAADGDAENLSAGGRVDAANSLALTPRPSLVINKLRLLDDGNERLDPGETLEIEVTLENLWLAATNVEAELIAPSIIDIVDGSAEITSIAKGGTATVRFTIQVGNPATAYSDLPFAVRLTADGGYLARRPFQLELAQLELNSSVDETLSTGLHDEFHTYHVNIDSPPRRGERLVIRTDAADEEGVDIDLLVKYARPAEYDIDLGANPDDAPTFYVDEDALVSADEGGDEFISIDNPKVGTYYITVVNFGLTESLEYSVSADLEEGGSGDGGGGGPFSPLSAAGLLAAALWRRRRQ